MNDSEKTTGSLALKPKPRIITIPATGQDLTRPLRVAAYARVSSDSNDQLHSYAAQTAYFAKLINSNPNWIFADIYADQGITGTSVEKRDDFLRMMEDCRSGRIDRILVKSTSRFARNTKESLEAVRELKSLGVSVYFEEQNIDTAQATGEALTAVFSALAQKESEAISERMRHSYQMRMQRGVFSTRCAPYGYRLVDTGRGKFSGKYALSGLLFCAECGTAYRRVVWTQHGEKRAVWRCTSRLDYGKRYCLHSPTLDEGPLQQAVLNAINSAMSDHGTLTAQLIDALEQELAPIPGESMSLGDIDRAMEGLGQQFNDLLREAADANNADSYTAQFQSISTAMAEFKRRKAMILQIRQEQEQTNRRVQAVASVLKTASSELAEWDDNVVYQLLEKVTVLSRERIRVTLRDGLEIEQAVEQPKRRKFA